VAVTEIALAPPPLPAPPPPSETPPAPEPPAPAAQPRRARAPRADKPEPVAKAAPVRTIDEAVKSAEEPVRFVTDPNGTSFGYGAVQRGGTAEAASPSARGQPAPGPARAGSAGQPVLSRPPRLAGSDPCRGFFPKRAGVDHGEVTLRVRVERDGSVRSVTVDRESPERQGFGAAARDCLLSKHFSPALDEGGREVAVVSPVTVRFSR
jgi:periplasmic protein TonB